MLRVDEPPEVTEVGLSVAVTPAGAPVTESETVCALPEVVAVETVAEVELPRTTLADVGLTVTEKLLPATALLTMQLLVALSNSVCTTYVRPSPPAMLPCWALQMSPISPLVLSYQ